MRNKSKRIEELQELEFAQIAQEFSTQKSLDGRAIVLLWIEKEGQKLFFIPGGTCFLTEDKAVEMIKKLGIEEVVELPFNNRDLEDLPDHEAIILT